jgi:hypothetical protein
VGWTDPGDAETLEVGMTEVPESTNRYELSAEDRYRVSRLHEEIRARLEELAMIGARATGITLPSDAVRKYDPKPSTLEAEATYIEVVCWEGGCGCIVLMSDGNHFWEYPCGGSH